MDTTIDINELRENIANLVDKASEREIPLYEVRSVFKTTKAGLSARNFDGLKNKLNSEFDISKLNELAKSMQDLVVSHIDFDDKLISIFKDIPDISDLYDKLTDVFSSDTDMATEPTNYCIYTRKDLSPYQTVFQFVVSREISVRKTLSPDDLREDMSEEFQEVIGIKKTPLDCHDFIMIDTKENLVIIGIDLALILGRNELSVAQHNFHNFLRRTLGIVLSNEVDLFPKIQEFYDFPIDKSNGVTEIYFMTPAGTAHHETLKGHGKDLREATYHRKGTEGVRNEKSNGKLLHNDITPYRISTRFYRESDTPIIDISLKSSYLAINTNNGSHLYDAYIYGSRSKVDLDFILDKLII